MPIFCGPINFCSIFIAGLLTLSSLLAPIGAGSNGHGKKILNLELTEHITPHANGEPLLRWSFSHSSSTMSMFMLIVWSANGDGIVVLLLLSRQVPRSIY